MRIGDRIFPYPVLNRDTAISDYLPSSDFHMEFERDESNSPIVSNGQIVFQNLHYVLSDIDLNNYVTSGAVLGAFIVECSATVYRKRFEISCNPADLCIPAKCVNGNIVVSCYLYAAKDIDHFKSSGFSLEYEGYDFSIDKYDILAVDDGFKFRIDHDPSEDEKIASIFTLVKDIDSKKNYITYSMNEKGITISLPAASYDAYLSIKNISEYQNIVFAILAIPALASCLNKILSPVDGDNTDQDSGNIDEICSDNPWFNAVCVSYQRSTGHNLADDLHLHTPLELAQIVLNCATCNGFTDFTKILLSGNEEGTDDDN